MNHMKRKRNRKIVRELESDTKTKEKQKKCNSYDYLVTGLEILTADQFINR